MFKELKQLNDGAVKELNHPVIRPIRPSEVNEEEKKRALNAVNLIKKKKDGSIKGRTCINGSKQKEYLSEDESVAAPTQSLDGFLVTCMLDAREKRSVITFDVPGAFLQPEMPKMKNIKGKDGKVLMKIMGDTFVEIMCEINPEYKDCIVIEKGQKVLYVEVLRSIYGCIEAALLWYEYYKGILEELGFEINAYDKCIANQIINGKQCTITWYVDDNKISHMDEEVMMNIIKKARKRLGRFKMTKGREHKFLGMEVIFTEDGKVKVRTKDQILETLQMLGETIDFSVCSPAARHLFKVNPNEKKLDEKRKKIFHSITAKLLFVEKRSRPDIETSISFLCKRVTKSDEDDWKKLKRLLAYLKETMDDYRILGIDKEEETKMISWIDASYAVHEDMKSHTGGTTSLGLGTLSNKSSAQKLNVKSACEAELVAMSEYIPYNIWLKNFLEK